jgi:hypothetical protein
MISSGFPLKEINAKCNTLCSSVWEGKGVAPGSYVVETLREENAVLSGDVHKNRSSCPG